MPRQYITLDSLWDLRRHQRNILSASCKGKLCFLVISLKHLQGVAILEKQIDTKNRKLKATANNNEPQRFESNWGPVWKHNRAQAGPPLRIAETVLPPNRPDIEESSEQVTENTYKSSLQPYLPAQTKWQDPEGLPSHGTADPPESFPSVKKLYLRQPSDHRLHSCDRGVERRILTKTNSPQAAPQFRYRHRKQITGTRQPNLLPTLKIWWAEHAWSWNAHPCGSSS
jgi:hypothetical protein